MKYQTLLSTCIFICFCLKSQAQDTIRLTNPSFEDGAPDCGQPPSAWFRYSNQNPGGPSIQPDCYEVSTPAFHGKRYLSLLTRRNQECDRVGQKLPEKSILQPDSTYRIRLQLAYSKELEIPKPKGKKFIAYDRPVKLRLWGYNNRFRKTELLAETPVINRTDWQGYDLTFQPVEGSYDEVQLEAYFDQEETFAYDGNILIDSISPILKMPSFNIPYGTLGTAIPLANPSFEDEAKCCEVPTGWYDCGKPDESPPDIQPGSFQVTLSPQEGATFLGLVVRDNETWEAVGQHLPVALQTGQAYVLRVYLARAELYLSLSRVTGEEVNYATPVRLRVWGGSGYCNKTELLAETPLISNTAWKEYALILNPKKNAYSYLTLEAYYNTPVAFPYNGNLLIDNISLYTLEK